jgi:hypothetical protein
MGATGGGGGSGGRVWDLGEVVRPEEGVRLEVDGARGAHLGFGSWGNTLYTMRK